MAYNNCSECEHYNKDTCPFFKRTEKLKRLACPMLKLQIKDYNDTPQEPKDCLKCPRRGTSKCAFLNRDYNAKCSCLWVLSEGHNAYDVDLMAKRLLARLDVIKGMEPVQQPMDYSRDDTKQIVNSMRPFNN